MVDLECFVVIMKSGHNLIAPAVDRTSLDNNYQVTTLSDKSEWLCVPNAKEATIRVRYSEVAGVLLTPRQDRGQIMVPRGLAG